MKIKIFGAAGGEVTGSAYLVQTDKAAVLIDAGMFQGGRASEEKNKLPEDTPVRSIDTILLTHGHLDHTGRVPLLVKFGYDNPIYATRETLDLSQIILMDSARLQSADAMRQNRKHWKKGDAPAEPLYTTENVEYMSELSRPVKLNTPVQVADGFVARWVEAGHMLGSGSIELTVDDNGKKKVIVFSGDLGPLAMPMLKPWQPLSKADFVFLESTYGDRNHRSYAETLKEFGSILAELEETGGRVLVPSFAIGRSQQIIYHLAELFHDKKVKPFPVYLDSPMALSAFAVYRKNQDSLDEEYQALRRKGVFPLNPSFFIPSPTANSSKELNGVKGPCMILAGAGMCNGGRILHHLAHGVDDPNTHVMIVGFQSYGSIGRRLVEKAETISIFGQEKPVRAKVHSLGGFSAHAGQSELLKWFSHLAPSKPRLALTHGEDGPRKTLAGLIKRDYGIEASLPQMNEVIEV